jgi:hypothetical protein
MATNPVTQGRLAEKVQQSIAAAERSRKQAPTEPALDPVLIEEGFALYNCGTEAQPLAAAPDVVIVDAIVSLLHFAEAIGLSCVEVREQAAREYAKSVMPS